MKESTMAPGTSKRKKLKNRLGASYKASRTHSDKLSAYKHGGTLPSHMMKKNVETHENNADREMRRLMDGDVYRSAGKTVKKSNVSKRRYA